MCELLREHFLEGRGVPLVALPTKIGIRETRHARCLHELTAAREALGIDAELPLLLLNRGGFRLVHRRCEGLEFETADRFAAEIQAAGSYEAWEAEASAHPEQWVFRLRIALMIAEAAVRFGETDGR